MLRMTRRHRSPLGSSPRRVFRFLSSQSCQAYNFHYQYLCLLLPGLMTSGFSVKHDPWMQSWYKMLNHRSNPVVEQPSPFKAVGICILQISWRQPLLLWLWTSARKTYIKHIRKNGPRSKKAAFTTALCSSAADPEIPSILLNATNQMPLRMVLISAQQTNSWYYFLHPRHCHTASYQSPRTVIFNAAMTNKHKMSTIYLYLFLFPWKVCSKCFQNARILIKIMAFK